MAKNRIPRKQLIRDGKIAREMLAKRGLQFADKDSAIERILKAEGSPILPGTIPYLPHAWTIHAARRILKDITSEWLIETKGDNKRMANITEFFKFNIKVLTDHEGTIKKEVTKMARYVKDIRKSDESVAIVDIFGPMRKKEALRGVRKLLVDAMAVSVVAKSNDDTITFVDWFEEWTDHLLKQWGEHQRNIK